MSTEQKKPEGAKAASEAARAAAAQKAAEEEARREIPFVSLADIVDGKRVAVVGNAEPSEDLGAQIDACDVVILLGRSEPNADAFVEKLEAFQNELGTKKA